MPVCNTCGGKDHVEEDGLLYCAECGTQCDAAIITESFNDTITASLIQSHQVQQIGSANRNLSKKRRYHPGRPWTKYEAYQLVLQAQADSLIVHGAKPAIRDVILRLWAKYLSLLEVAFVDQRKTRLLPKGIECRGWQRELSLGNLENPEIKLNSEKRMKNQGYGQQSRMDFLQKEESPSGMPVKRYKGGKSHSASHFRESSYDSSDCSVGEGGVTTLSSTHDDLCVSGTEIEDKHWVSHCLSKESKENHGDISNCSKGSSTDEMPSFVLDMNLMKTVAFCYIGCLFACPCISLSDIMRWIMDGSLPYREVTQYLNPDMRLSGCDYHLFTPVYVNSRKLRHTAGCLMRFLGFDVMPKIPLTHIATSIIIQLELPDEFIVRVVDLMRKVPVDLVIQWGQCFSRYVSLPNIDALCAAYVLVTVKLIFCLNDRVERQFSTYTKEVQAVVGPETQLFDWTMWQSHVTRKFSSLSAWPDNNVGYLDGMNVDELCDVFHTADYRKQNFGISSLFGKRVRGSRRRKQVAMFVQDSRELLKRSTNLMLDRLNNRDAVSSKRLQSTVNGVVSHLNNFSECRLEHILHPHSFVTSLFTKDVVTGTDCAFRSQYDACEEPVVFDEPFLPPLPTCGETAASSDNSSDLRDREVKRLLLMHQSVASRRYVIYPQYCQLTAGKAERHRKEVSAVRMKQHWSYKHMLCLLSCLVCCPETAVEEMVWAIESGLTRKPERDRM